MINHEIAVIFNNMSSYQQMSKERNAFFRARAFRKAAEVIEKFPHDLSNPEWYLDTKKLVKIEGIGQGTALYIKEYVETGRIQEYENMKAASPVNLEELQRIQGIGPKKILKLYEELGVTDIESLKMAAETDQIANLDGFGNKSQENILESIEFAIINKDRISIATAEDEIAKIKEYLSHDSNINKLEIAGSYRRKKETIGDVDILVTSDDPKSTMKYFVDYPKTEKVLGHGDTKASIWLKAKFQVDIRVVPDKSFGAALQYFTGSRDHNIKLRNIAISNKYKLSEYGLFSRDTDDVIAGEKEIDIYNKLGLQFIPPELRENLDEIELAKNNKIPNLVTIDDIEGDFHTHTTFSDGKNTVTEMAEAARQMGYKYIGISDHFGNLKIAGALDESMFRDYIDTIRRTDNESSGIKIFASAEVEIDKEGNLDYDPSLLSELDYVISSVHMSTKMDVKTMTNRIIKALKNPHTKILAHPTGRLIGQRPGFEFDHKEVFRIAKEENVLLEINAHPERLDLNDLLAKLAKDMGCKIIINTDAHSTEELSLMKYGIYTARRGYITKQDIRSPAGLLL